MLTDNFEQNKQWNILYLYVKCLIISMAHTKLRGKLCYFVSQMYPKSTDSPLKIEFSI